MVSELGINISPLGRGMRSPDSGADRGKLGVGSGFLTNSEFLSNQLGSANPPLINR